MNILIGNATTLIYYIRRNLSPIWSAQQARISSIAKHCLNYLATLLSLMTHCFHKNRHVKVKESPITPMVTEQRELEQQEIKSDGGAAPRERLIVNY